MSKPLNLFYQTLYFRQNLKKVIKIDPKISFNYVINKGSNNIVKLCPKETLGLSTICIRKSPKNCALHIRIRGGRGSGGSVGMEGERGWRRKKGWRKEEGVEEGRSKKYIFPEKYKIDKYKNGHHMS